MVNYKNMSMVDVAYLILEERNEKVSFSELFNMVAEKLEFSEAEKDEKISKFYTNLSLDGRLLFLDGNYWDLRKKYKLENAKINMSDVYNDIEEEARANEDSEDYEQGEKAALGLEDEDSEEDEDFDDVASRMDE